MKLMQWFLKNIGPVSFAADLSEAEVRMTLRDVFVPGTECPLKGEVNENSFTLLHRPMNAKGLPRVVLNGEFSEENGKTNITVSVGMKILNFIEYFLVDVAFLILGVIGILAGAPDMGMILLSLLSIGLGVGLLMLERFMVVRIFDSSVRRIRTVLGMAPEELPKIK